MVHTNSDSAKKEKEAVTFAICVCTIWYSHSIISTAGCTTVLPYNKKELKVVRPMLAANQNFSHFFYYR